MEWRHFKEGTVPVYTTPEFFHAHPHIPSYHQLGYEERMHMTVQAVVQTVLDNDIHDMLDLGCGDGELLWRVMMHQDIPWMVNARGITAGREDVARARIRGVDVVKGDFVAGADEYEVAPLVVMSEVLEHLMDPHGFLKQLHSRPIKFLVASTPSAETGDWHYEHHAWSWDLPGFAKMMTDAGWHITQQVECRAGVNHHNGETREQYFQCVVVKR